MAITVDAVYEDGALKPAQPLPLREHEQVRVTVHTAISRARRTAGLMGWKGNAEWADRFAVDPELDFPPPPEQP